MTGKDRAAATSALALGTAFEDSAPATVAGCLLEGFMTDRAAAEELGCHPRTIHNLCNRLGVPIVKCGPRRIIQIELLRARLRGEPLPKRRGRPPPLRGDRASKGKAA